ncbi:MAG: alpha/beta hydrolase [Congregibacter sp.]
MDVYFATNRRPSPKETPTNFKADFNPDGISALRFGLARVQGKRVTVHTAPEKLVPDSEGRELKLERSQLGSHKMFHDLRKLMRQKGRDTVVFVHGYNVSFKEALKAASDLGEKLQGVDGGKGVNMVLFSWPSDGSMAPFLAYSNDRRDAAASGAGLARGLLKAYDFLTELGSEELCDQRIHLICHSMGNYVLRHAMQEFLRQSSRRPIRIFDQVMLMAPDEDDDTFEHDHKLRLLPRIARRVNVYFNRNDRAMSISDFTKGNPERLGDDGPRQPFQIPAKVTQVDCTGVVSGLVEHSYYKDTPAVVDDVVAVLSGTEPQEVANRKFIEDRNRYQLI